MRGMGLKEGEYYLLDGSVVHITEACGEVCRVAKFCEIDGSWSPRVYEVKHVLKGKTLPRDFVERHYEEVQKELRAGCEGDLLEAVARGLAEEDEDE